MIEQSVVDKITDYCKLNEIEDIKPFITKLIETGLNVEKYGSTPFAKVKPKIKEVEVIKEIEVEKEVIKEVPVEIIKEVEVEKKVYVTNDDEVNKLALNITKLNEELSVCKKIKKNYSELVTKHKELNETNALKDQTIEELENTIVKKDSEIEKLKKNSDFYGE